MKNTMLDNMLNIRGKAGGPLSMQPQELAKGGYTHQSLDRTL
jgi:hypothetical protein